MFIGNMRVCFEALMCVGYIEDYRMSGMLTEGAPVVISFSRDKTTAQVMRDIQGRL